MVAITQQNDNIIFMENNTITGLEKKPHSIILATELELLEDLGTIKGKLGELLDSIETDLQISFEDPEKIYHEMEKSNCLARVERLSRVLEAVELDQELSISEETETHYANAVIPNNKGIQIAFAEGQAPGPVRTVVAFGKTIIGFKTDNLSVEEINFNESEIRDINERRYLCRHVTGKLRKVDIRYVVMRIPRQMMDDKHLTQEETPDLPFVFRAFKIPQID